MDSSSLNHIDVINNKGKEDAWRFTSVYGVLKTSKKHETWELLCSLNRKFILRLM